MEHFTPVASLIGGVIIGLAAALLLLFNGRICGISGIFGGLLSAKPNDTLWRFFFVAGLLTGGVLLRFVYPQAFHIELDRSVTAIVFAGLLVGVGTRMGSGCTSGHGICGLGRLSPRSLVATVVFLGCGIVAAIAVHALFGGTL